MDFLRQLNSDVKPIYLFYGDESYLKDIWQSEIINRVLSPATKGLNLEISEGKGIEIAKTIELAQSLPFMAEHRLFILKNGSFFESANKTNAEAFLSSLKDIPESSIFILVEQNIDKRTKLYKHITKTGLILEAVLPTEAVLASWIVDICKSSNKQLSNATAIKAIRQLPQNMYSIKNEIEKLIIYIGDEKLINFDHIEQVCTKSLQAKIFELTKAIANKNIQKAQKEYANLIALRESPLMVISMIARQFRLALQCYSLAKASTQKEIAASLALPSFAIKEYTEMGKSFGATTMANMLKLCLETDYKIKTGGIAAELGVQILIVHSIKNFTNNTPSLKQF